MNNVATGVIANKIQDWYKIRDMLKIRGMLSLTINMTNKRSLMIKRRKGAFKKLNNWLRSYNRLKFQWEKTVNKYHDLALCTL